MSLSYFRLRPWAWLMTFTGIQTNTFFGGETGGNVCSRRRRWHRKQGSTCGVLVCWAYQPRYSLPAVQQCNWWDLSAQIIVSAGDQMMISLRWWIMQNKIMAAFSPMVDHAVFVRSLSIGPFRFHPVYGRSTVVPEIIWWNVDETIVQMQISGNEKGDNITDGYGAWELINALWE